MLNYLFNTISWGFYMKCWEDLWQRFKCYGEQFQYCLKMQAPTQDSFPCFGNSESFDSFKLRNNYHSLQNLLLLIVPSFSVQH